MNPEFALNVDYDIFKEYTRQQIDIVWDEQIVAHRILKLEFSEVEEDEVCNRLFGVPSDWNYEDAPPKLLMQYDLLDNEMDFLDTLDGFVYLFFGENEKNLIFYSVMSSGMHPLN